MRPKIQQPATKKGQKKQNQGNHLMDINRKNWPGMIMGKKPHLGKVYSVDCSGVSSVNQFPQELLTTRRMGKQRPQRRRMVKLFGGRPPTFLHQQGNMTYPCAPVGTLHSFTSSIRLLYLFWTFSGWWWQPFAQVIRVSLYQEVLTTFPQFTHLIPARTLGPPEKPNRPIAVMCPALRWVVPIIVWEREREIEIEKEKEKER